MKPVTRILSILIATAALAVHADDASVAEQLKALGGKVTLQNGFATQVTITDCSKLGEAEFRAIGSLTKLKSLTLYGNCTGLNDATFAHLTALKELETIGTDRVQITDDGLKQFAAFQNLKTASFFHTSFGMKGFTGRGFGYLKACPKLERLTVAGISMGDEGFAAIATITQVKDFSTWHTYQTEAGNAHIAAMPNLVSVKLGQRLPGGGRKAPSLSDASIPTIATMKTVETLRIGEARFTVDALRGLKAMPKLKLLNLYESELTAADVEKLREALPGVKIEWQAATEEQRKKIEMYLK